MLIGLVVLLATSPFAQQPDESNARDYEKGARYVREKLEEARAGNVDASFLSFLTIQTHLKVSTQEYDAAVHTAEPLLELTEVMKGPESVETARVLEMLADIYSNIDQLQDSVPLLHRASNIYAKTKDKDPTPYIRTLISLGATYLFLDDGEKAETVLLEALSLAEGESGTESQPVGITSCILAGVYSKLGRTVQEAAARARAHRSKLPCEKRVEKPPN